jgi:DNA-binding GntR family transcriptional regulator
MYDLLRYDITHQYFKCGQKISLKLLQEKYQVSQTPIREALNRLQQDGLVEYINNVGVRIVEIREKDIIEICDLCSAIICSAIKLAMANGDLLKLKNELKCHLEAQQKCMNEANNNDFWFHANEFHKVFYKYSGNSRLAKTANQIQGQMDILITKYHDIENSWDLSIKEHELVYLAVKDEDVTRAIYYMELHHLNAKKMLLGQSMY